MAPEADHAKMVSRTDFLGLGLQSIQITRTNMLYGTCGKVLISGGEKKLVCVSGGLELTKSIKHYVLCQGCFRNSNKSPQFLLRVLLGGVAKASALL